MILKQKIIKRSDLRANADVYYVFGDNTKRVGMGGQAGEMRGEPNAFGIPTKRLPSQYDDSFFSDEDFEEVKIIIDKHINELEKIVRNGHIVVIPQDGLGTGLSELPTRAPKIFKYLESRLDYLETL